MVYGSQRYQNVMDIQRGEKLKTQYDRIQAADSFASLMDAGEPKNTECSAFDCGRNAKTRSVAAFPNILKSEERSYPPPIHEDTAHSACPSDLKITLKN